MQMTVSELIDHLKDYDGDAEVRLATQVDWPFEYSVQSVASAEEMLRLAGHFFRTVRFSDAEAEDAPNIVYIAEGDQLGYLPESAKAVWAIQLAVRMESQLLDARDSWRAGAMHTNT